MSILVSGCGYLKRITFQTNVDYEIFLLTFSTERYIQYCPRLLFDSTQYANIPETENFNLITYALYIEYYM